MWSGAFKRLSGWLVLGESSILPYGLYFEAIFCFSKDRRDVVTARSIIGMGA